MQEEIDDSNHKCKRCWDKGYEGFGGNWHYCSFCELGPALKAKHDEIDAKAGPDVMKFDEFKALVEQAAKDYMFRSGGFHEHPNIQRLVQNPEPNFIAYACLLLDDKTLFQAFAILSSLIPEGKGPPIPSYYRGRIPVILECYRYWALHEGHIESKGNASGYWVEDRHGNYAKWH